MQWNNMNHNTLTGLTVIYTCPFVVKSCKVKKSWYAHMTCGASMHFPMYPMAPYFAGHWQVKKFERTNDSTNVHACGLWCKAHLGWSQSRRCTQDW